MIPKSVKQFSDQIMRQQNSMTPLLALDATRLGLAPVRRAPRGIDRVELAYARHFLHNWPGGCIGVLPTIWGVRCYDRETLLKGLAAVEALWRETVEADDDPVYARVKAFLAGEPLPPPPNRRMKPPLWEKTRGFMRILSATGFSFGRSVARTLPKGAIYLNIGQLEVFRPFLSWLHRRPDVLGVFMIHDVIPIEEPAHHQRIGVWLHHRIVRNTAAFAKAIIVPSRAAGASVLRELGKHGGGGLPVHAGTLPVPTEFLAPAEPDPALDGKTYFVVCGVIDSYKNHLLLLEAWKALVARHGNAAPKLVIAGSPGVSGAAVLEWIGRHGSLSPHVLLAPGLSTRALRRVVAGARALLMPSLAEGFGLPIVEALAQGTPVIASDIPPHREAGAGGDVTYLPPTDREAWLACIEAFGDRPKGTAPYRPKYHPKTWEDYFAELECFLRETATRPAPG